MILISILGDFHSSILPMFFEFKERLAHHIILHDDSNHDTNETKKLIKAQENFIKQYKDDKGINYKLSTIIVHEDDYNSINQAYKKIIKKAKTPQDIYLNTTDGLSSLSVILSHKFLKFGSNIISYDRFANTYNLHTPNTITTHKIKNSLDIKNHLKLKGYKLLNFTNKYTLKSRKEYILKLTSNLKEFKNYTKLYKEYKKTKGKYSKLLAKIDKQDINFVKGGVFEEYIYWLIKDNIKVDDIMTGVHIEFDKDMQNELDILFIKDNHLHTIECKFTDNFKTNEYLYKVDSIMSFLDDDGKGMILTIGDKKLGFQNKARAKYSDIDFYSTKNFNEQRFLDEIKMFFNLKAKS